MPQFQMLDPNPGFGSQLGQALGQGFQGGISQGITKFFEDKQKKQQLQDLFSALGISPSSEKQSPEELGEQDQELSSQERGQSSFSRNITPQKLIAATAVNPQIGSAVGKIYEGEKKAEEQQKKREEKFEDRAFKRNEKYLEKLGEAQTSLPKKKLALQQMRAAVDSGEFSGIRNALADYTGLDFLKNAPAQTVNSAIKEYLISDLASITGRPNQFIEKQLSLALVNPQFAQEANEMILQGLEGLQKLKEREIEIADELEEKFISQGKEIPRNFQKLVSNKMTKEVEDFEKSYENNIRKTFGSIDKESSQFPKGTIRTSKKTGEREAWTGKEWKSIK